MSWGTGGSYLHLMVGSVQELASVGSPFFAETNVRRIRVETVIDASCYTVVGAAFGYASAEVILNLKVLDGSRVVGSSRLSLSRSIAALLWVSSHGASGQYTLSCEFPHSLGTPRTYSAIAELETWAGGGGLAVVSPATAYGQATVAHVTATLIR